MNKYTKFSFIYACFFRKDKWKKGYILFKNDQMNTLI